MPDFGEIIRWVSENESALSGMAAIAAIVGVAMSAFAVGARSLFKRRSVVPHAGSEAAAAPTQAVDPSEPLLAVLAFDNLSSDPELQFFSDGVSGEIIQRLSRGTRLRVIGRNTSFQFRGEQKAEAAERLRCSHVLDGSIQRAAGRVRISAHLVEAAGCTTIWSERYDRSLEDVFAVQDEISESIAGALDRAFSSSATEAVDPDVYDLYLRARVESYAPDELQRAIEILTDVTRRAPGFAEAWGQLAYARAWHFFYQPFAERPALAEQVKREAERARALDPQNVDALGAALFVVPPFGYFAETEAALERLQRAPRVGRSGGYIGFFLRTTGRIRESLEEVERAVALNALDPMALNILGVARMAAGKLDEAVPLYEGLIERVPEMSFPVSSLLRVHTFREDWAAVGRLLRIAEEREMREFQEGLPFFRIKRDPTPENQSRWKQNLEEQVGRSGCIEVSQMVYSAHLGFVDDVYRLAEGARLGPSGTPDDMMGPDAYRTSLFFQVSLPELRNDPRFTRLCARYGLVEFWLQTGKWPDCASEVPYDFKRECEAAKDVPKEPFFAPGR